ncbi:MAG: hypothetical protein IJC99_05220, partial [Clostridia bacterium]|nr:hypothetical protein [Clostridia bacterium]
ASFQGKILNLLFPVFLMLAFWIAKFFAEMRFCRKNALKIFSFDEPSSFCAKIFSAFFAFDFCAFF